MTKKPNTTDQSSEQESSQRIPLTEGHQPIIKGHQPSPPAGDAVVGGHQPETSLDQGTPPEGGSGVPAAPTGDQNSGSESGGGEGGGSVAEE